VAPRPRDPQDGRIVARAQFVQQELEHALPRERARWVPGIRNEEKEVAARKPLVEPIAQRIDYLLRLSGGRGLRGNGYGFKVPLEAARVLDEKVGLCRPAATARLDLNPASKPKQDLVEQQFKKGRIVLLAVLRTQALA